MVESAPTAMLLNNGLLRVIVVGVLPIIVVPLLIVVGVENDIATLVWGCTTVAVLMVTVRLL